MEPTNKGIFGSIKAYVGSVGKPSSEKKETEIKEKAANFTNNDKEVAKTQIRSGYFSEIKQPPVKPAQVPLLDLSKLPSNDTELNKLEGNHFIAEVEARESLAGNKKIFEESKVATLNTQIFFTQKDFDGLNSEDSLDDEVTKKLLEDLNKTLKDDTKKT